MPIGRPSTDLVGTLRATSLFGRLPPALFHELCSHVELLTVPGGHTIIRQGELEECLYVVLHGRLRALVEHAGGEQVVGEIGRGESVGEMAVLTGEPRSATVRAVRDSELLRIAKADFDRVLQTSPSAALDVARLLVNRLQQLIHPGRLARPPATIAIVPAGKDLSVTTFARALTRSLTSIGTAFCVDSRYVDEVLGPGASLTAPADPNGARVGGWLNGLETRYRFVVYEADAALSTWTRRCLRQADRILVAAGADSDGSIGEIEAEVWATDAMARGDVELVLLHAGSGTPRRGSPRWLAPPRRVSMHHHVRADSAADLGRLTRLIGGQGVGVVLGGGGARAFAHIGVARAFREAGVPIDLVGGASMGAVMAAQIAAGWDPDTMLEATRRGFVESGSLFDVTVPVMSMIAGRRFQRLVERMFGDLRVEDLWTKYFCVSTNLTRARTVVHERGPLAKWLCASISIPGLAPPVFHRGDLLVDGSLLETIPSRVMRAYGRGPIVAVDVTAPVDVAVDPAYRENPTTGTILWNRLNPFERRRLPSIFRILLRAAMLSSEADRVNGEVDLSIRPDVGGFDLLDWAAIERIVEIGYRAACERLTDWPPPAAPPPPPP